MRSLNALIWRNLTAHALRSILTALAITLGVAMVLAASIVGQAAGRSASELADERPRVDLEVFSRDNAPFDDSVSDTLRTSPDVERVSPSLRVEAESIDPEISKLTLLGVDPESYAALHEPELAGGAFLDQPDTVVLPMVIAIDNHLHVGDEITLKAGDRVVALTVAGRLKMESEGVGVGQSPTAFVPLNTAQTLAGVSGQIDRVEVVLRPNTDANQVKADLAQQVGTDLVVVRAEVVGGAAFNTMLVQGGLAMVGLIILFAAGFVIMNAFAMSVAGRTREIGALRSLGMTRHQVLRTVLAEAGLLGLIGAVLGLLVGVGLAWSVMRVMGALGDAPFVVPWWGVVFSPLLGLAVTLVGALQPAWRASRISPLVAVRPETRITSGWYVQSGWRVGIVLLLFLPIFAAYGLVARPDIWTAMAVTGLGMAALLVATVLLLPSLVTPLAALFRPFLLRRFGVAGRLAVDNLGRNRLRSALTAGALTIGLTTIIATSGLLTLFFEGSIGPIASMSHEDINIAPDFAKMMASGELSIENFYQSMATLPPLDPALVDALTSLAEAGVIELERNGIAPVPPELLTVSGAPGGVFVDPEIYLRIGNFDFFEGTPDQALEWMQRGRAVLLQPIAAERLGVGVGETIPLETPHGKVEFTVAGVGGNSLFSPIFPYADGEAYFDLSGPFGLSIVIPEGQDPEAVQSQVEEIAASFPEIAVMTDMESAVDQSSMMLDRFQGLLNGLLLLAVVVAALGVVNTMVINVTERGREIGLLRAVGATQRQVRQAVVAEAATLGLMAVIIAGVLSLAMLLVYTVIVTPNGWGSLGVRSDWAATWSNLLSALSDMGIAALTALIFGPLVAALAAYYPARQAAALDVVEATRSERVTLKPTATRRPERRNQVFQKKPGFSLTWTLAWRNLEQGRTRTILSALAVALGAAMTVAADVTSRAILNAFAESGDALTFMAGLLDQLDVMLMLVGVGITFAAGFLVFNAFAMSITQRRRQIGALRSLGMTRRQVMRLVLVEALITGGGGTVLGLVAGPLLGRGVIALMRALLGEGIFVFAASRVSISILLLATAMGLTVTLLSILIPAWRATRISPLFALREETGLLEKPGFFHKFWSLGLLIIVVLTIYLVVAPPGEWVQPPWGAILTGSHVLLWLGCLALILPALIGGVGRWVRAPLTRFWGATGRLIADNLGRRRGRITLTIVTLAVALAMIVSMTGFMRFAWDELMRPKIEGGVQRGAWLVAPFKIEEGMAAYTNMDAIQLSPDAIAEIRETLQGRGQIVELYYVIVPELSFLGSSYFSFVGDPRLLQQGGDWLFAFTEGDWETAMPIMETGCGVLVTPLITGKNDVLLGETFEVTGVDGPVECTIAGIGSPLVGASIISIAAGESFGATEPMSAGAWPLPGVDRDAFTADLVAVVDRIPGVEATELEGLAELQTEVMAVLPNMLNALLLLAIVAAALGVVNTTMMSVAERRRELGLLRAVGATRRQVTAVVAGEAALMGLIGGGLGLVAGAGIIVILAVVYGGNSWGIPDLDLWGAAWRSVQPALLNGLVGLVLAPLTSAGAAWLPVRAILRGSTIETMEAERQQAVSPRRAVVGILGRGSIRTRFALGTATLMTLVLVGLIAVVTTHARTRIEEQMHDALRTMVTWNAGMIELGLPDEAETLDFDTLTTGQAFDFDSDALLQFESLVDGMTDNGLVDFTIADRDDVVLIGLDTRDIGALAPELEMTDEAHVTSEREGGEWLIHATSPVRNDDGLLVGSVRLTIDAEEIQDFLGKLRNRLGAVGVAIILFGVAVSWGLATPLARATRQLSDRAARVARGEYLPHPHTPTFLSRFSLRTKLTAVLVLIIVVMVGVLELVAIPIERRHVEDTLKDGLVAGIEWIGQAASESFDAELTEFSPGQFVTFEEMLEMTETLDLARLQELTDQMRSDDMAYTALVDEEGTIVLSDQLALIGEKVAAPPDTQIEETTWRGEEVWVASTVLRRGQDGERVGALQMALRLNRVEAFLDESRNLFRLTGLIAVLAGVLLAQAIGGAVTAPVRRLAADTRRVGEGDLSVQFRVDSADLGRRDELALLANAYNQMVVGLREREWLRDMFGRFVSREVAEAIRSGQVRLEGENRVVSVLFCDIRGFTARSERSTPEEVVALLNEYLPVVVEAAQAHAGTVNKFGGDSTLVIYGAPRRLQESAYQAVLTALKMRAGLARLNERLVERGEEPIRIGVGINTGMALAGAVGPEERQEYTVIGDTVNLASRIEGLNKQYPEHDVLISGQTYEALGRRRAEFALTDLGEVRIRGKAEPVRVWAVET